MKKQIFTSILSIVALFITTNLVAVGPSPVPNTFDSASDLTGWKAAQGNISQVNGTLQLDVTGGYWALATYEPKDEITGEMVGFDWDLVAHRIICLKKMQQVGLTRIKFNFWETDHLLEIKKAVNVGDEDAQVLFYDMNDLNLGVNTKRYNNLQLANEGVDPGYVLNFDFLMAFASMEDADAYVAALTTGIDEEKESAIYYTIEGNSLQIHTNNQIDKVQLFDISGKKHPVSLNENSFDISSLKQGAYILQINGDTALKILL